MPIVFIAVAINAMPISLVMPLLPPLGARYGATPFEVSILFALMPLVGIVGNPLWGRVSDRLGRRAAMSLTLGGTALAFLAFAFADSLAALFATRALQGVFHGANAIALAHVADTTAPAERAKGMGRVLGSMGIGLALGPALGGVLMGSGPEITHFWPSVAAAGLSAIAALTVFLFLKERAAAAAAPGRPKPKPDWAAILRNPGLWLLLGLVFVSGFKFNAEQFAYQYWGAAVDWSPRAIAFGLAVLSLGLLFTSFILVGLFTRVFGDEKALAIAVAADLTLLVVFILTAGAPFAFVFLFGMAFFAPLWGTILASVLSRRAPPGVQGLIQGASTSVQLAGRIGGTLIAGALTAGQGFRAVYVLLAAMMVFVLVQAIRFARGTQTPNTDVLPSRNG